MKQTVIVSTYNQPLWLAKVLHGYLHQTFRDFELLIADDGSDQRTKEVIEAFRRVADFPVRHVWHEDRGFRKCTILNVATVQAAADYLVFTDGDCIPRKDFLATHDRLAEPGCFLSGGYCKLPMDLSHRGHRQRPGIHPRLAPPTRVDPDLPRAQTRARTQTGRVVRPGFAHQAVMERAQCLNLETPCPRRQRPQRGDALWRGRP